MVAVITFVMTTGAWLLAVLQPPRYRAVSTASIAPVSATLSPYDVVHSIDALQLRSIGATVAALASSPQTRVAVAAGSETVIEGMVVPETSLVRIVVEDRDPRRAAVIANRVPAALSGQSVAALRLYRVAMAAPAARPAAPYLPRPKRAATAGLLIGAFTGIVFSTVRRSHA
jgi:hypothetical protein